MPTMFVYQNTAYTPHEWVAQNFAASWLKDIQAVVAFWLADAPVLYTQTSGSTGAPKTIGLAREVVQASAQATLSFLGITSGNLVLFLPAHFIGGKMMIIRALVGGLRLYVFEPKAMLPQLNHDFALMALTPFQAANALNQLNKAANIILGGGAVSPALETQLQNVKAAVFNSYGMTETASHIALRKLNGKGRSAYFSTLPGVTCTQDARGCLVIHAPHLHVHNLVTHDVVHLQSATRFKWLGRADFVVNSGGVKLHPEEIEHTLATAIHQPFFVAGLPDTRLGEKLVLVIEAEAPFPVSLTPLKRIEQPKEIYFLPHFVYTDTGKINRKKTLEKLLRTGNG